MRAKLFKVDPLSTIRNNKLIMQGGKLETSAKLRVFVSNISSFCFVVRVRWTALKVYLVVIINLSLIYIRIASI